MIKKIKQLWKTYVFFRDSFKRDEWKLGNESYYVYDSSFRCIWIGCSSMFFDGYKAHVQISINKWKRTCSPHIPRILKYPLWLHCKAMVKRLEKKNESNA